MSTKPKLRRSVGTTLLTLYGIGNIVGAGVYVLVGKIAGHAGYLSIVAFLIAALVALCAALCYAELAARFPVSAGISVYLHEAFKARRLSTVVGLLLVLAGSISTATLLKGFGGYFTSFVSIDPRIAVGGVMLILLAVMLRGIKESVGAAAVLTIVEVGGLLFLMAAILLADPTAVTNYSGHFSQSLGSLGWHSGRFTDCFLRLHRLRRHGKYCRRSEEAANGFSPRYLNIHGCRNSVVCSRNGGSPGRLNPASARRKFGTPGRCLQGCYGPVGNDHYRC
jgi:amino acid transporter